MDCIEARHNRRLWLTSPTGTGSAIAQTIAEAYYYEAGLLAESFFFPQFVADRKVDTFLIPTINLPAVSECPPSPARTFNQLHISR